MTIKTRLLASIVLPILILSVAFQALKQPLTKGVVRNVEITTLAESELANREKILNQFFAKNNSPLSKHSKTFVAVANKYNLDYRLLPAISCTESSCGKFLIPDSYNPFGWGIYGTKVTRFASYDEAIEKVGEGISKHYVAKGLNTPEKMAPVYTPPSSAHWSANTRFFMNQMDKIALN